MGLERFVDLLIDANLLVFVAALALVVTDACLCLLGYRRSYAARLRLLTATLAGVALLPVAMWAAKSVSFMTPPHLTDYLLAQYLKGNIVVSASNFEGFLSLRETVLAAVGLGNNLWIFALVLTTLTVMAARATYIMLSAWRVFGIVRHAHTIKSIGRVRVLVSDTVAVPFSTRGIRNFYVVVPQSIVMDPRTMAISIGHELQHIRQKDVSAEVLVAALSPLFIVNPFFWFLTRRLRTLRELACDFSYLRRSRFGTRRYAQALLAVARQAAQQRKRNKMGSFSVAFVGPKTPFARSTKSSLARRVTALANGETSGPNRYVSNGLMVSTVAAMLFGALSLQSTSGWTHDRLMLSSVVNLERLDTYNTAFGSYVWE